MVDHVRIDNAIGARGSRTLTYDYLQTRVSRLEYVLARQDYSLHPCFARIVEVLNNSKCNYVIL